MFSDITITDLNGPSYRRYCPRNARACEPLLRMRLRCPIQCMPYGKRLTHRSEAKS